MNAKTKSNSYDGRNKERRGPDNGCSVEVEEDLNTIGIKHRQVTSEWREVVLKCRA